MVLSDCIFSLPRSDSLHTLFISSSVKVPHPRSTQCRGLTGFGRTLRLRYCWLGSLRLGLGAWFMFGRCLAIMWQFVFDGYLGAAPAGMLCRSGWRSILSTPRWSRRCRTKSSLNWWGMRSTSRRWLLRCYTLPLAALCSGGRPLGGMKAGLGCALALGGQDGGSKARGARAGCGGP